jgi:hypothetical protein
VIRGERLLSVAVVILSEAKNLGSKFTPVKKIGTARDVSLRST